MSGFNLKLKIIPVPLFEVRRFFSFLYKSDVDELALSSDVEFDELNELDFGIVNFVVDDVSDDVVDALDDEKLKEEWLQKKLLQTLNKNEFNNSP